MKLSQVIFSASLALVLLGCANGKNTDLTETIDPQPAIAVAADTRIQAEKQQADLLSYREYARATNNLEQAQKGLHNGSRSTYTLEKAELATADFEKAIQQARVRSANATRILAARKSALDAGLRNSDALVAEMADVDDDLRGETNNFSKLLEPKKFSAFQKKYLALEIKAVQFTELNAVEKSIAKATRADADDLAPKTLRQALLDVSEAENMIAQSPRDPSVHKQSVSDAVASSVLLSDVMEVILAAPGTPENVALKIVQQNRELKKLSQNVGTLKKNLKATESSLQKSETTLMAQDKVLMSTQSNLVKTESALMQQNKALESNSIQIRFQNAMDEAVKQFSEDEAEVYQQGNKLIFRLKRINFATGDSTLPATSKPLLAKINNIIKSINAEVIDVQGHTDSIGSDSLNSKLSNDRAISVARYLSSLKGGYKLQYRGYGESRPIASNETAEGRAINRRVDLEVTARKISG